MPRALQDNLRLHTVTAVALCLCLVLGAVESILWGRTALDDMVPLWAMLLLMFYDHFTHPWHGTANHGSRTGAWCVLLLAAAGMGLGIVMTKCAVLYDNGQLSQSLGNDGSMMLRNGSLALLAVAVMLYRSGWGMAGDHWQLPLTSLLVLPFYELLLLEFSFPLRLVSTNIAVTVLRLLSFSVSSNGTTLFWQNQELAITDACSGISLIGLLLFIAYWLVRKIKAPAWQKSCWFSMLLLWVLLANTLRLLLTLFGFMVWGKAIFESTPHYALGCFFVVTSSLLLWFSSVLLFKDDASQTEEKTP